MRTRNLALAIVSAFSLVAFYAGAAARGEDNLAADAELVETRTEIPKLKAAAEYKMKDGVLEIELSEYAGYSGLVAANNGLEPTEDSVFFKKHGFKVKITLSEEESWSGLNSGRMGASATTVDVLAAYGRQFEVTVPLLIGFSRGADGVVVASNINRINDLAGKVLATAQFTESDFLIRYLAQEAGLGVKMLPNLATKPEAGKLNMVYCADGFGAGDLFLRDVKAGKNRLAGCVTWDPKTSEVAKGAEGKARILVTNRNLLIVADMLVVNKAFAKANPQIVQGLVSGILEGNNLVRTAPDKYADVLKKAFKWDADAARAQLAKVHLANLPENQAFFAGTIDSAGSFGFIYEMAAYVYGPELIGKGFDGMKFLDLSHLAAIEKAGTFKDQKAAITPLRSKAGSAESSGSDQEALLSKDIRFLFKPNSAKLEMDNKDNTKGLDSIAQLLKISPGSRVLLRGHADGSKLPDFRKQGGESMVIQKKLELKNLSKSRCAEIQQILQDTYKVDLARIDVQGVGADEPTGKGPDADRRVEVQWFTLE